MHFDTLELSSTLETSDQPEEYGQQLLVHRLLINGEAPYNEFPVDLFELAKSAQLDGEFEIATCGCGNAGCAGIDEGIQVEHLPDATIWKCPEPMSNRNTPLDSAHPQGYRFYRFRPVQYVDAIDNGLRRIKSLALSAPAVSLPVYGTTLENVLALDPRVFSTDRPGPARRLIARRIDVHAYHQQIIANGITYRIEQLELPTELLALHDEFSRQCVFPAGPSDFPAFEAYLQAGRRFCLALRSGLSDHNPTIRLLYRPYRDREAAPWEVAEVFR